MLASEDISNISSEAAVLASLVYHPEFYYLADTLLPNHFVDKANRYLYAAIGELAKSDIKTIDAFNVINILNAREATKNYRDVLSIELVQDFLDNAGEIARHTEQEYKTQVQMIMEAAFRRDTLRKLRECEAVCKDLDQKQVEKKIYEMIDEVMMEFAVGDEVVEFGDVVDELWYEIEAHQDGNSAGLRSFSPL